MDNFIIIYKILKALEKAMDMPEFDINNIMWDALKISENRWYSIMGMLIKNGYVEGIEITQFLTGNVGVTDHGICITLKGLEYLNDNSIMKRAMRTLQGAKEIKGIID